jgi:cardiolipin synthase
VLPDLLDARIVAAASRAHYEDLLEVGVVIMHHDGGLLHAKTATVDRRLALVTSANLDMRSFWLNFEVSMFVYDRDFAGMLRFLQTKYVGQSHRVHLDEWRRRPFWRRLSDNVAQLFGPLM